jgi:hypothetical protein
MPVAIAAFFATRFSFAPVLRTTPFADLLVFFDEVPDFLRLDFFMDSSRSLFRSAWLILHCAARTVCVAFLRGQLIETGRVSVGAAAFRWHSGPGRPMAKTTNPTFGQGGCLGGVRGTRMRDTGPAVEH